MNIHLPNDRRQRPLSALKAPMTTQSRQPHPPAGHLLKLVCEQPEHQYDPLLSSTAGKVRKTIKKSRPTVLRLAYTQSIATLRR